MSLEISSSRWVMYRGSLRHSDRTRLSPRARGLWLTTFCTPLVTSYRKVTTLITTVGNERSERSELPTEPNNERSELLAWLGLAWVV
jgi:hypothetical protein